MASDLCERSVETIPVGERDGLPFLPRALPRCHSLHTDVQQEALSGRELTVSLTQESWLSKNMSEKKPTKIYFTHSVQKCIVEYKH